jgi:8-oxo-dGTP diphosphatase / 2-hydroxy-dATP diphosphatase
MKKLLTLAMIVKENQLLLGMKKRGFGEGRWNGFGGKVGEGESIEKAALREVTEEVGIVPREMLEVGVLTFSFENEEKVLEVHVFTVTSYDGEPVESEEMRPEWFEIENIPYEQMWPDDIHWLPLLIAGKKFKGSFLFDRPSDSKYTSKILRQEIIEI